MPDYMVSSPEGHAYKVTAPEGATHEQILSYAQQQHEANVLPYDVYQKFSSGQLPEDQRASLEQDIKSGLIRLPQGAAMPNLPKATTGMDYYMAPYQAARAVVQNTAVGLYGQLSGEIKGIATEVMNNSYGSGQAEQITNESIKNAAQNYGYQPTSQPGQQLTEAVGQAMEPLGALAPMAEASLVGNLANAAKPQIAASKFVQSIKNPTPALTEEAIAAPKTPETPIISEPETVKQVEPAPSYSAARLEDLPQEIRDQILKNNPDITPEEASRHIEAATLPIPVNLTKGEGLKDPVIISNERNMRGVKEDYAQFYKERSDALKQNLEVAKERAAPDVQHADIVDAGQHLVDSIKNIVEADKKSVDADYKALRDANGGKFPVDAKEFADNAINALNQEDKFGYLKRNAPEIAGKLEDYSSGKKQLNYNLFESLRSELAAEARRFDRAGDGTSSHVISVVRNELESLPLSKDLSDSIKPLADKARANAKSVFDKVKSDPAYRAVYDDEAQKGSYSPLADSFINKYVIKAPRANVEQLANKIANDQEAKQTIAASVIDHLKHSGGIDTRTNSGNLNQSGYNKALTNIAPKLDLLVDKKTSNLLHQIGNVARNTQDRPEGSFVSTSNTTTSLMAAFPKTTAEHATNMFFHGAPVGSVIRATADSLGAKKQFAKSTQPLGKGVSEKISKASLETVTKDPKVEAKLIEKKSDPKKYKAFVKSITENEKTKALLKLIKKPESLTTEEKLILAVIQEEDNK